MTRFTEADVVVVGLVVASAAEKFENLLKIAWAPRVLSDQLWLQRRLIPPR